jgi:U3 small nucleolar RNA-associated protein 22
MESISPKRRKLQHNEDEESTPPPLRSWPNETPQAANKSRPQFLAKQPQGLQNRPKDADAGALYDGKLYKSSKFKLQVDFLLDEIRPNYEKQFVKTDEARLQTGILFVMYSCRAP